tara:strand:+ start:256 stop:489 length:234 start_codon:yes stop_codon:yes gene_type:complete
MQMENLSKAVSMALQAREVAREADSVARQAILDATPVLTLDMQIDFESEYYDEAVATADLRERWQRERQQRTWGVGG